MTHFILECPLRQCRTEEALEKMGESMKSTKRALDVDWSDAQAEQAQHDKHERMRNVAQKEEVG